MSTTAGTTRTCLQHIKPMIVVGFLALSLMVGASASTNRVGAEALQVSPVSAIGRSDCPGGGR